MADQVQCPNCGGYKVNTEKKEPITETRKVHISLGKWTFQGIAAILLWRLIGACAFIYLLNISQVIALLVSVFIIALPILILGIASPSAIREAQRGTLHQTKVITVGTKYHFYCQLCGYRWLWDTGTPSPKVALRPDLIAQGEQRLEEEHRKQQEDAAALYYLTHQGKK